MWNWLRPHLYSNCLLMDNCFWTIGYICLYFLSKLAKKKKRPCILLISLLISLLLWCITFILMVKKTDVISGADVPASPFHWEASNRRIFWDFYLHLVALCMFTSNPRKSGQDKRRWKRVLALKIYWKPLGSKEKTQG